MTPFPISTLYDLLAELDRVDSELDRLGGGTVVDRAQYIAHRDRLLTTRRQVLDAIAALQPKEAQA